MRPAKFCIFLQTEAVKNGVQIPERGSFMNSETKKSGTSIFTSKSQLPRYVRNIAYQMKLYGKSYISRVFPVRTHHQAISFRNNKTNANASPTKKHRVGFALFLMAECWDSKCALHTCAVALPTASPRLRNSYACGSNEFAKCVVFGHFC